MYHVISCHPALCMNNESRFAGFTDSTLTCQACIIRLSGSNSFSFSQDNLGFTPDMGFYETHPLPIDNFLRPRFQVVPPASSQFHIYYVAEARQSLLNSVRMELAEGLDVKEMSLEALDLHTKAIAEYYSSSSPTTSAALVAFSPTHTTVCFYLLLITVSLLSFCVILFHRQWCLLFSHPHRFFCRASGRFYKWLNIRPLTLKTMTPFFCISPWRVSCTTGARPRNFSVTCFFPVASPYWN